MADRMTREQRHGCMSRIRSSNTKPEMLLRKGLFSCGFRYRKNVKSLPGSPDIVLPKYRTVIFVNGCFWHGHAGCRYYTVPKSNTSFWEKKIRGNIERDRKDIALLEAMSWNVITVWECELKPQSLEEIILRVSDILARNRESWIRNCEERRQRKIRAENDLKERKAAEKEIARLLDVPDRIVRLSRKDRDSF